eukprot:g6063.t3
MAAESDDSNDGSGDDDDDDDEEEEDEIEESDDEEEQRNAKINSKKGKKAAFNPFDEIETGGAGDDGAGDDDYNPFADFMAGMDEDD